MSFVKRNLILAVVFITGAAVLIVEVVATRILAPYFGNTIFTFSSVIGIILAALSCGYYIGGRLADAKPSAQRFYALILMGGVSVLVIQILVKLLLPKLGYSLSMISGPLVVSILFFFIPGFLLGTLSPFAIKLQHVQLGDFGIGRVSGQVFFWSTLGSILGTISSGFWLIPHFGADHIIIAVAYVLIGIGGIGVISTGKRRVLAALVVGLIVIIFELFYRIIPSSTPSYVIFQEEGLYQEIKVQEGEYQHRPMRLLVQDLSSNSAIYLDTGKMVFDYMKYYELYKVFVPNMKRALVIGGGAYNIPKQILEEESEVIFDVAEIEPSLYDVAKKYFQVRDNPRLHNHVEDGRRFLHDTPERYDFIFSDVYFSFASVPTHFTTQEFFQLSYDRLNDGGIFLANFVGSLSPDARELIFSVIKTIKTVYPQVYVFATEDPEGTEPQNFILVGHKSDKKLEFNQNTLAAFTSPILKGLPNREMWISQNDLEPYPVLTDNYAPVEYMTTKVIRHYNAHIREMMGMAAD